MTNHQRGSITRAEKSSFLQLEPNWNEWTRQRPSAALQENGELASSFYAGLPNVSEELNAELERPLDEQELHAALQSMEGGTAPGTDGLPVEFYKAFWAEIGVDWLAVLNETLAESSLGSPAKEGRPAGL
ncbi:hypothetical protein MHYP_G00230610 [Metynnis hypsauchen]